MDYIVYHVFNRNDCWLIRAKDMVIEGESVFMKWCDLYRYSNSHTHQIRSKYLIHTREYHIYTIQELYKELCT
jgi:hypothetical protein|nr:MAG TPA: hypothetical protein [Caudoviricetes sp.]